MGMNEVEERMAHFEAALQSFHLAVQRSIREIERQHETVDAMWRDTMRAAYDARWIPLRDQLFEYRDRVAPSYIETMRVRLQYLRNYLYGNQH